MSLAWRAEPPPAEPRTGAAAPAGRKSLYAGIALLALVFALLAAGAMLHNWQHHQRIVTQQLTAIARLKAGQLQDWLRERRRDSDMVRTALLFREALPRWRENGNPTDHQRLLDRLDEFRATMGYAGVAIYAPRGEPLLQVGILGHGFSPTLRDTVRHVLTDGLPRSTDVYRMDDPRPAHAHLDFVAPIPPLPGGTASDAAIVLRTDVESGLFAALQTWPIPSPSAEILLLRREGDDARIINTLRHRRAPPLSLRLGAGLASPAFHAGRQPGTLLEGADYRGVPTLGVAIPVVGSDWWVIAKVDRAEALREANQNTWWIALTALLAWSFAAAFAALLLQRRELRHAWRLRQEQAERLRTLRLLDAIATASDDAIYAQDETGHFILFNRACERITGKSAAEALGQDESALFPAAVAARVLADNRRVLTEKTAISVEDTIPSGDGERTFLTSKSPLLDDQGRLVGLFGISRDITQRKAMEETLRKSETFVKAVLDNLPVGVAVNAVTPGVQFSYMNDQFSRCYRTTRERLAEPDAFWEAVYEDPEFRRTIRARVLADCASGDPDRMHWDEVPIARAGGPTTYISARNIPLPDKGLMISLVWDVSEYRGALESLRDSRELLRSVVEHVPLRVFWKDTQLNYLGCNTVFARDAGMERPEDLLGKDDYQLAWRQQAELYRADDRQVMASGLPRIGYEEPQTTPEGHLVWLRTSKVPLRDAAGRIIGLLGVYEEITEQKQAQEALRARNEELERFNQAMVDRECAMIELKRRINALTVQAGGEAPYPLPFLPADADEAQD